MKRFIFWLLLGGVVVVSPAFSQGALLEVEVLGNNQYRLPIYGTASEKAHTYRAYVEAVKGERYGIRVRNNSGFRIGLVIAVDGRNIISGKKSVLKKNERMYILDPYASAVYDGWRTSQNQVNRFYFTSAPDSYAAVWGDHSAMGVIAIAVFPEERPPEPLYERRGATKDQGEMRRGAPMPKMQAREEPGTGFGEGKYSPSVRVDFEAEDVAAERHFLKYEWRETLCRKGVIDCREPRNRFWPEDRGRGYAPYPPPYRR
jgi:hypothetical protein